MGAWHMIAGVALLVGSAFWASCGRGSEGRALREQGEVAQGTVARMETSMGVMVLRLYENEAPNTVANFMHLASKGFYDGVTFHRVIAGFMIQGGCPKGDGTGGPGWRIADEFVKGLSHDDVGVLSMANAGPNTNGSQFFIALAPQRHLDGRHTVFGKLVEGSDVLREMGSVKTGANDRPLTTVTIKSITLFRDGQRLTGTQPKPRTL